MMYKVTVPITPMMSGRGNPAKTLHSEKVCLGQYRFVWLPQTI